MDKSTGEKKGLYVLLSRSKVGPDRHFSQPHTNHFFPLCNCDSWLMFWALNPPLNFIVDGDCVHRPKCVLRVRWYSILWKEGETGRRGEERMKWGHLSGGSKDPRRTSAKGTVECNPLTLCPSTPLGEVQWYYHQCFSSPHFSCCLQPPMRLWCGTSPFPNH